ncbi:MAG TPA: CBS domain-containing protein, partial [Polyangia bacterium]|nr:CBS domain-containing protein [Polyangia bacterium]
MSPGPVLQYPTVRQYMTPSPCTVARNQPLSIAQRLMHERNIHHLPVLDGDQVVGILSQRDILLVESFPGVNPTDLRVKEAMSPAPYQATADAPLAEVVATLLERRIGSAIIVEDERAIGVFTTNDALRALADLLA